MTFEQLIVQQRPYIDQVARDLSRRNYLAPAEAEEFGCVVLRALERNEFELLRAFDGRSTWETYLTLVVTREFFLFQGDLWGQWRPTAAARRSGAAAVLLEELVVRDHMTVDEAADVMRAVHRVDMPRYRLLELARQLRLRTSSADDPSGDDPQHDAQVRGALQSALGMLGADDRLIVELRFRDQQSLTRIARLMRLEPRPLQRRLDHLKQVIGRTLLSRGMTSTEVEALLQSAESGTPDARQKWQTVLTPPSR